MAAWSGWFIYKSSFVVEGRRVFCLFEDAMISMTYARNLVEGHGLNWARAGLPVEGFSHPLWTALMIPANAPGIDLRFRSLLVQLLSLGILVAHALLVRRLMLRHFSSGGTSARHWLPAVLLTAFYYPLNYWALMGMESGLQALLTTASVLLALDVVCLGEDRHRELWLLAAVAYLLRMDMLLMVAAVQVFVVAAGGLRRGRRAWWQGLALFAVVAAGYGAFRWLYFHDVLPNTYYLKLYRIPLGVRLGRGLAMLQRALADHVLLTVAVTAGVGAVALARRDHRGGEGRGSGFGRRLALPVALFLAACAYSVYVGGDAWDADLNVRANRFVVYVMPQLFVTFNALLNRAIERAAAAEQADRERRWRILTAAATVVALLSADGLWLAQRDVENWRTIAVADPPLQVSVQTAIYTNLQKLRRALGPARAHALVSTSTAGIPAFFSDYRMVDVLGYNERHIARLPPAFPLRADSYVPGHVKWDYFYIIERYHPDALLQPWGGSGIRWSWLRAKGYRRFHDGDFWLLPPHG
jgi:hypothetical protein